MPSLTSLIKGTAESGEGAVTGRVISFEGGVYRVEIGGKVSPFKAAQGIAPQAGQLVKIGVSRTGRRYIETVLGSVVRTTIKEVWVDG